MDCSYCNGTGGSPGHPCYHCDGTGDSQGYMSYKSRKY